jgi:hypothetical protein
MDTVQTEVLLRVVGGDLPPTGWGAGPVIWVAALLVAGAALLVIRRVGGFKWAAGFGVLVAAGILASSGTGPADAAHAPEITIDRESARSGSVPVSLDVTALKSKVYRVEASAKAPHGISLELDGVALSSDPEPVAEVASEDDNGIVKVTLTVTIPKNLAKGEYRLTVRYVAIDERPLVDKVSATFPDRVYDGTTKVEPAPGTVTLPQVEQGDDVVVNQPVFTAAGKDAGTWDITCATSGIGGKDTWMYRFADTLTTTQTLTINPRPLEFAGTVYASKLVSQADPVAIPAASLRVADARSFAGLVDGEGFELDLGGTFSVDFGTVREVLESKPISSTDGAIALANPQGGALAANYTLTRPKLWGEVVQPVVLEVKASAAGQGMEVLKYWNNSYRIDWGDGTTPTPMTGESDEGIQHIFAKPGTYNVTLTSMRNEIQRWTWDKGDSDAGPLVIDDDGTTVDNVRVAAFPSLRAFQPSAGVAEDNFFNNFNMGGAITALAPGSFDTSQITQAGDSFFRMFNADGDLTTLPAGSFKTGAITTVGDDFFRDFCGGPITALPDGSFDLSSVTKVGDGFFAGFVAPHWGSDPSAIKSLPAGSFSFGSLRVVGDEFFGEFNQDGGLTSLPAGSFRLEQITSVGSDFFSAFNLLGDLKSLPAGSFRLGKITQVGDGFFSAFNETGSLTSLPAGSFNLEGLTAVFGQDFFGTFNKNGPLTSLPAGSFRTGNLEWAGMFFFSEFNSSGSLTSLPAGSFRLDGFEVCTQDFFVDFNEEGALTSLPAGSFNTDNITEVGAAFFMEFNRQGSLTSLPEGSFNTSGIRLARDAFFTGFNLNGAITTLPASFAWPDVQAPGWAESFMYAFDSPNATLNTSALAIVGHLRTPPDERFTFSSNQPDWDKLPFQWRSR